MEHLTDDEYQRIYEEGYEDGLNDSWRNPYEGEESIAYQDGYKQGEAEREDDE